MIYCMIDGKKAFPTTDEAIKITRENPYLKKTDSYTYDITFPLSVMENRLVFGSMNRIDVRKKVQKYKMCRLYAGNRLIISGTGVVTGNDNEKVKLQIIAGVSELKYNARTDKLYIDTINAYPEAESFFPAMGIIDYTAGEDEDSQANRKAYGRILDVTDVLTSDRQVIGDVSKFVFSYIKDQTNDKSGNTLMYVREGKKGRDTGICMMRPCIQPNLMFILKCVLEYMGYKLISNRYDTYPWNRIVVANAHVTMKIKNALPHWTVSKFLDEFCNFFNASVVMDETRKTVSIVANNEVNTAATVSYECEDEFSTEYDEDGVEYIGTSNLKFGRENEDGDIIPEDVFKEFDLKDYPSQTAMWDAINKMDVQQCMQTLFHEPGGYCYFTFDSEKDDYPTTGNIALKYCGQFSELLRDKESDTSIELKIVPAAVQDTDNVQYTGMAETRRGSYIFPVSEIAVTSMVPAVDNSHDESTYVEADYVSVKDAIEDGEGKGSDSVDEVMPVIFIPKYMFRQDRYEIKGKTFEQLVKPVMPEGGLYVFCGYCDSDLSFYYGKKGANPDIEANSMSLYKLERLTTLGQFHDAGNIITTKINPNNQVVIKFISDDIPDPKKTYRFHNKLFLCSKVEMNVKDNGVAKEKTGYFYEI